jgi:hypothetical protein
VRGPRDDFAASSPGWVGRRGWVWWAELTCSRNDQPNEFCSFHAGPVRSVPLAERGKGDADMGAGQPSVEKIAQQL